MTDDLTAEQRLLRAIFGAPCDGSTECPAPVHQFPCEAASQNSSSPAAPREVRTGLAPCSVYSDQPCACRGGLEPSVATCTRRREHARGLSSPPGTQSGGEV